MRLLSRVSRLALSLGVFGLALAAAGAGCSDDETAPGAGGGGTTSTTNGVGGEAPGCVPEDCPQPQSECEYALCDGGACGFGNIQEGTACAGGVCDGQGSCVDHCGDGVKNFSETDVDCGGSCEPCALGASCTIEDDCTTGFCTDGLCCETMCFGVCEACNLAGMEGTCAPHPEGTDPDDDCAPLTCNGSGACD